MSIDNPSLVALLALFLVLCPCCYRILYPLPPGPFRLPLIGNPWAIPLSNQSQKFWEWSRRMVQSKGSEIVYFQNFGTPLVVLNSQHSVEDLLNKQSRYSSNRPPVTPFLQIWVGDVVFANGELFKSHRTLFKKHFSPRDKKFPQGHAEQALPDLLNGFRHSPKDWQRHIRIMMARVIHGVAYGITIDSTGDHWVDSAEAMISVLNEAALPGAYFVYLFRFLPSWFPRPYFIRRVDDCNGIRSKTISATFEAVPKGVDSFVSRCLQDESYGTMTQLIIDTAGTMYEGGADTTTIALRTFILAMALFPERQEAAQAEMDSVLGTNDPAYGEEDKLPYFKAVLRECFSYSAFPHVTNQDLQYNGYKIPQGTVILANVWGILRDPKIYGSNADNFDPERWLKRDERGWQWDNDLPDSYNLSFGFGARTPGQFECRLVVRSKTCKALGK
ncbi:hypothetical protein D9758_009768 [Tetrapyrgos nigripes]|uniref:Cytochrome P450 n=1 Tax=Tetrapyrgos nigripes TaxID=182062 RepID=A0A8H5GK22_9AGAR|nr:hypothetical protein D9758_009768 [Tetrapyrgos nigripes]